MAARTISASLGHGGAHVVAIDAELRIDLLDLRTERHRAAVGEGRQLRVDRFDQGTELVNLWAEAPPEMAKEPWPRLDGYQKNIEGEEVARIPMTKKSSETGDVFTIDLSATALTLSWAGQAWEASIE